MSFNYPHFDIFLPPVHSPEPEWCLSLDRLHPLDGLTILENSDWLMQGTKLIHLNKMATLTNLHAKIQDKNKNWTENTGNCSYSSLDRRLYDSGVMNLCWCNKPELVYNGQFEEHYYCRQLQQLSTFYDVQYVYLWYNEQPLSWIIKSHTTK